MLDSQIATRFACALFVALGRRMVSAADLDAYVDGVFGAALGQHGFTKVGVRRWVRSRNAPIRGLFTINALKGGTYCPAWGISSGFAPSGSGRRFSRQSTDKNAVMDLVMDPIDPSGEVPRAAYRFIAGYDTAIPTRAVDKCAAHFVPLALADLDPVRTQADFCRAFGERSDLRYQRFQFSNYLQHNVVRAMILLRAGRREEGRLALDEFCRTFELDPGDKVLAAYVQLADGFAAQHGAAAEGRPQAGDRG